MGNISDRYSKKQSSKLPEPRREPMTYTKQKSCHPPKKTLEDVYKQNERIEKKLDALNERMKEMANQNERLIAAVDALTEAQVKQTEAVGKLTSESAEEIGLIRQLLEGVGGDNPDVEAAIGRLDTVKTNLETATTSIEGVTTALDEFTPANPPPPTEPNP